MGWQRWEREQREAGRFLAGSRCDEAVEGDSARGFKSVSAAAEEYGATRVQPSPQRGEEVFLFLKCVCRGKAAGQQRILPSVP